MCRQTLRILQWNADGLSIKQHESRLRLNDDTPPSVSVFCTLRVDRPTNQRGEELLILIRGDQVFQKIGEAYIPPLECLTVQVQLSCRKRATI